MTADASLQRIVQLVRPYIPNRRHAQLHYLDALLDYVDDAGWRSRPGHIQTVAQFGLLSRLWEDISADFAAAGIPVMPLKGIIWSRKLFPHPALRPISDLDILVQQEHV